jgi:hypothetical protein
MYTFRISEWAPNFSGGTRIRKIRIRIKQTGERRKSSQLQYRYHSASQRFVYKTAVRTTTTGQNRRADTHQPRDHAATSPTDK